MVGHAAKLLYTTQSPPCDKYKFETCIRLPHTYIRFAMLDISWGPEALYVTLLFSVFLASTESLIIDCRLYKSSSTWRLSTLNMLKLECLNITMFPIMILGAARIPSEGGGQLAP